MYQLYTCTNCTFYNYTFRDLKVDNSSLLSYLSKIKLLLALSLLAVKILKSYLSRHVFHRWNYEVFIERACQVFKIWWSSKIQYALNYSWNSLGLVFINITLLCGWHNLGPHWVQIFHSLSTFCSSFLPS